MISVKRIRIFEGTLVVLFFLQAFRMFFSQILPDIQMSDPAISLTSTTALALILLLLGLVVVTLFAPQIRSHQLITAVAVIIAVTRFTMALDDPILALISSVVLIISALCYFLTIIRINRFTWVTTVILSLSLDVLFRIYDTLDLSMRPWLEIEIGNLLYRIPFFIIQMFLSLLLIISTLFLRNNRSIEEHVPGKLPIWSGLALGGFLSLQFIVLFVPNVIARWTAMPYESIAPWIVGALILPLFPAVRYTFGALVSHLEGRLKGWLIFFILVVFLIIGYRLPGVISSSGLIICSFITTMLLWWIPEPLDDKEDSTTALSLSLGVVFFLLSIFLYAETLSSNPAISYLTGQSLAIIITNTIFCCFPLIIYAEENPWMDTFLILEDGIPFSLLITFVGLTIVLVSPSPPDVMAFSEPIRVATYNINYGFNEQRDFVFDQTALAIKASDADVIALQEVDTGHPASYGMDQVQFLARHLQMYPVFQTGGNKLQGLAILSRQHPTNSRGSLININIDTALMLAVELKIPDSDITMQILTGEMLSASQTDRLAQYAMLFDLIDQDKPAIIAADLAGSTNDILYQQLLQSGFIDPDSILGIEQNYTYPSTNPTIRTDMVLLRGLIPVSSYQVDSIASDHRLVLVLAQIE